ncbi:hypothetical protein PFISCL1PPCAC_25037, partial [Pristionchus fissidentatus]
SSVATSSGFANLFPSSSNNSSHHHSHLYFSLKNTREPPPPIGGSLSRLPAAAAAAAAAASSPFGPDYDTNGQKIKRPMNAFMVWAQMRRAEITAVSSKVHNSLISKALGVEWREMSDDQKAPFVLKAKELRDDLFREHPHYVYRPRKRKQRSAPYSPRPA